MFFFSEYPNLSVQVYEFLVVLEKYVFMHLGIEKTLIVTSAVIH